MFRNSSRLCFSFPSQFRVSFLTRRPISSITFRTYISIPNFVSIPTSVPFPTLQRRFLSQPAPQPNPNQDQQDNSVSSSSTEQSLDSSENQNQNWVEHPYVIDWRTNTEQIPHHTAPVVFSGRRSFPERVQLFLIDRFGINVGQLFSRSAPWKPKLDFLLTKSGKILREFVSSAPKGFDFVKFLMESRQRHRDFLTSLAVHDYEYIRNVSIKSFAETIIHQMSETRGKAHNEHDVISVENSEFLGADYLDENPSLIFSFEAVHATRIWIGETLFDKDDANQKKPKEAPVITVKHYRYVSTWTLEEDKILLAGLFVLSADTYY